VTDVIFTKEATDNLISQAPHIYELTFDAQKADTYLLTMKTHINQSLRYFPKLGRPAEEYGKNIRKLIHQRYTILYRILDNDKISIITIYKQNLPSL